MNKVNVFTQCLIIITMALAGFSCSGGESVLKDKPNVILIMTDDQGAYYVYVRLIS